MSLIIRDVSPRLIHRGCASEGSGIHMLEDVMPATRGQPSGRIVFEMVGIHIYSKGWLYEQIVHTEGQ
jgi:hypothetical protein